MRRRGAGAPGLAGSAAAALLLVCLGLPAGVRAQGQSGLDDELRLVRHAAELETSGDFPGSERALLRALERNPTSLNALIALERVLAMQGRTAHLIPALDRYLERDPRSAVAHQMRVRAYAALNLLDELERAAGDWIEATPTIETPYREMARVWRVRHEPTRAVAVLELGRARIDRADALALELGDVFAEAGDAAGAAREWNRAVGPDGRGFLLVQRRILQLPDGGAAVIPLLVQALTGVPETVARRKSAAQLAIQAGLAEPSERIAGELAAKLEGTERRNLLIEVARRADGAGLNRLAYWAYGELVRGGGAADQMLALRTRLAELALAVGDTAAAAATYLELESAYAAGSPERRQAVAVRIQLLARDADADAARRELTAFRTEFPEAPELDAAAAAVANALLDAGDIAAAEDVLAGARGPHTGVARARIFVRRGEVERARKELLVSAPALHGAEATQTLALATLLGRLSPEGGDLVGRSLSLSSAGEREAAVEKLVEGSERLPNAERAAILEHAAWLADQAELDAVAEETRREIVTAHARSREAPAALLSLARTIAAREPASAEARLLLERLILEHPRSALVPQARRQLDRLMGRTPPDSGAATRRPGPMEAR